LNEFLVTITTEYRAPALSLSKEFLKCKVLAYALKLTQPKFGARLSPANNLLSYRRWQTGENEVRSLAHLEIYFSWKVIPTDRHLLRLLCLIQYHFII